MAKIKHNDFLDTVDEVITDAKNAGILHLHAEGNSLNGRSIKIKGKDHYHFGTTGYLGLEQDPRLKDAAIEAIRNCGTQFPLSKSYISHPLYAELEEKVEAIYNAPIIITKNSTLGHIAVIPCAVRDEDAVILDHQVHWSVQNATQILKTRGIPVEMIRHNNMQMLEDKIKKFTKHQKIWYMADGVYSMYGDYAPMQELMSLCAKYPQLHLYFDDVHGMSWCGKNGAGFIMDKLGRLSERMILFGTLSKTFGASGAVVVCENKDLHSKIKNFGGPLTFSAQLEPASVAAAIASARIHLSPEIYKLQEDLQGKIHHFTVLLEKTDIPVVENNYSPVFYIGTGMPITGYKLVQRLMKEGFYVNLGLFPAVPVKNTGIRITISRHNTKSDIEKLVDALVYHYPKALEETGSSLDRVHNAFRMKEPLKVLKKESNFSDGLKVQLERSILQVDKNEWDSFFAGQGCFDWEALRFLEGAFTDNDPVPENNWKFYYLIIRDAKKRPVLVTFFTLSLWKDDMLAPASISIETERKRIKDPYYLTSKVLSMGSLFTEGDHLYLDRSNPSWKEALSIMIRELEKLERMSEPGMMVLRDFTEDDELNAIFHGQGFIKASMPEACIYSDFSWETMEDYVASLSSRSRRHFNNDIKPYQEKFDIYIKENLVEKEIKLYYQLYKNVKNNNPGLNTFSYPYELFYKMASHPNWEFIAIHLKPEFDTRKDPEPVGVMFCYKNSGLTYVPSLIGMDYDFAHKYQVYRQLLFQTIKRCKEINFKKIDFGMTAAFEKKKVGASVMPKFSYIQTSDNFILELIGLMRNES